MVRAFFKGERTGKDFLFVCPAKDRFTRCNNADFEQCDNLLICTNCGATYPVVPNFILKENNDNENRN